jgi:hypothetical protein
MRNGVQGKMAGKPEHKGRRRMRGQQVGDGRADDGVRAQDHWVGPVVLLDLAEAGLTIHCGPVPV